MRNAASVLMLLLACIVAGCVADRVPPDITTFSECPSTLRTGVRLTASVAQVAVPDGVQEPSGSVKLIDGVGRRILLSVEVSEGLPRVRLLQNSLAVSTYGGTFAGWARVIQPAGATARQSLQVSGGFLRIAPFSPEPKLHTYSQTIDVLVLPGGVPVSGLVLLPGPMWNEAGRPTTPYDLKMVLEPIEHMTELTVVHATGRFEFTVLHHSGNHERWKCSIESDFQLVDHDSVLPALWNLQHLERVGPKRDTIALYNRTVGAFPVTFLDPATAAGFAKWLRETRASRVGEYEIGLIAPEEATGFRPAPSQGLADLMVAQLGSD